MPGVRIGFLSTLYHTSHIIREQKWIEHELGVRVVWSLYGTGPEMVAAFKRGELDIGFMGLPPAMIGIDAGAPIICVGGGHIEGTVIVGPSGSLSTQDDVSFAEVMSGFEGSRVGIPAAGSIHDVIFRDLVIRHSLHTVQVVNFDWADLIPHAVHKGEIDFAVGTPALGVLCQRECNMRVVVPAGALWPFNPSYGILVTREVQEQRSFVEGFLLLHERACNLMREDPHQAAQLTVKALPWVEEDFVLDVYRVSPRYCASLPKEYLDATMAFVPVLKGLGYLRGWLTVPEVFDTRCTERAHPGPHHY